MTEGTDPKALMRAFAPVAPAVRLLRHTFEYGEVLDADVFVINYSHDDVEAPLQVEISGSGFATGFIPNTSLVDSRGMIRRHAFPHGAVFLGFLLKKGRG